jgi:hypothetical protein
MSESEVEPYPGEQFSHPAANLDELKAQGILLHPLDAHC